MNTIRENKIQGIFEDLEGNCFDSQGYRMKEPSKVIYQFLRDFLLGIPDDFFSLLVSQDMERLPEGNIIIIVRNRLNKTSLGIMIGDDFANSFYTEKKKTISIVRTKKMEDLLNSKDFLISIQDFINKLNRECSTPSPVYSPVS